MSLSKIQIVVDVTPPDWFRGQKERLADILQTLISKFAVEEVHATRKQLLAHVTVSLLDVGDIAAFRLRVLEAIR